jgi:hypothetical protein
LLITNARHHDLLEHSIQAIASSEQLLHERTSEEMVLVGLHNALRYLGEITGTRIEMATDVVARTATAKEVTAGHRLYGLVGSGGPADQDLAYAYDMAAVGQELQPHLSAQLKRVSYGGQE